MNGILIAAGAAAVLWIAITLAEKYIARRGGETFIDFANFIDANGMSKERFYDVAKSLDHKPVTRLSKGRLLIKSSDAERILSEFEIAKVGKGRVIAKEAKMLVVSSTAGAMVSKLVDAFDKSSLKDGDRDLGARLEHHPKALMIAPDETVRTPKQLWKRVSATAEAQDGAVIVIPGFAAWVLSAQNVSAEVKLDCMRWLRQGYSDRSRRAPWANWVNEDNPAYSYIYRKQVDCDEVDYVLGLCETLAVMLLEEPVYLDEAHQVLYLISDDTRPQDNNILGWPED